MAALLGMTDDPRSVAFREFCRLVGSDRDVSGNVTSLRVWDGDERDPMPPAPDDLPWVRLSPRGGSPRWVSNRMVETPLVVHVEVMTGGTDAVDSINLWGAIEGVILSARVRSAMLALGVTEMNVTGSGYGVEVHQPRWEPVVPDAIYNKCDVVLTMYRDAGG